VALVSQIFMVWIYGLYFDFVFWVIFFFIFLWGWIFNFFPVCYRNCWFIFNYWIA
jgi:hypothetical protein